MIGLPVHDVISILITHWLELGVFLLTSSCGVRELRELEDEDGDRVGGRKEGAEGGETEGG